jgi:Poly (ADP-ribose) glycohydrolase (PARG), Macro domain fold
MSVDRRTFLAAALMEQHPPRWRDRNKLVVAGLSCAPGARHHGSIGYSRWPAMALPAHVPPLPADLVVAKGGFYDYRPALEDAVEWHVNFADPHLFVAYGGPLLAQDELQVAEHPALGALREALVAAGDPALSVDDGGPTPVLVTGIERRVSIDTEPNAAAGRSWGLYGNAFARADPEIVRGATTPLDPPTVTNLIAMAALPGGSGAYGPEEIRSILVTAFTGFRAAALESDRLASGAPVVVHSGFWGCGAFGGNRVLMSALQMAAARMAGLDRLVLHTGGPDGDQPVEEARPVLEGLIGPAGIEASALIQRLAYQRFAWGVSDGN